MKYFIVLFSLLVFLSAPALAEYYRYKDQNGVIKYTDDISQIPPSQRPTSGRYQESSSYHSPQKKTEHSESDKDSVAGTHAADAAEAQGDNPTAYNRENYDKFKKEKERLDAIQKKLGEEFIALKAEENKIRQEKPSRSSVVTERHNQAVHEIENKINNFNEKNAEFKKELEAFNAKVKAFNELGKAEQAKMIPGNDQKADTEEE